MSGYLWKFYLEDDVENFRRVLLESGYTTRSGGATLKGHTGAKDTIGLGIGSPGSFGTSPSLVVKGKKDVDPALGHGSLTLTRADVNYRDPMGRTLLHLAASSKSQNAYEFASALLGHPLTDIYVQDAENAWTALHRAFYAGNLAIAHNIILRDRQDALGHGSGQIHQLAGGLIKIKDMEGNGPFDLFEMTLQGKMTNTIHLRHHPSANDDSDDESMPGMIAEDKARGSLISYTNLQGDEMFTFGSNQNITLGFGDEDDRHNPERISLRRPDHLYFEAYQEYVKSLSSHWAGGDLSKSSIIQPVFVTDLPSVIRNKPIRIQNVHMSKLHSAVLTDDPKSNLHVCGHGQGGRLGLGDERTRFQFVCVDGGAIANKKIAAVALGQNHTVALSDQGEVFTWGSNDCGQLGYDLPKSPGRDEEAIQTSPRRIFGPLKKETVIGIAASRIHSVAYTETALYTWGKNEGQLGIVHSESRSTKIQAVPRDVAASRFSSPIASVSAIDRATTVLLESREVIVFAHYIYIKVDFHLYGFDNYFLKSSFMTTKYDATPNRICKIVSAGDTICALSTSGQVYTVTVSEPPGLQNNEASTTNPKLGSKNALSTPVRVWSNKKAHLSARDVDIDQSGSIIIVTQAGSVWRRVKRAKIKDATAVGSGENKPKDFKFSRIPGLTRVTAVRASGFGAYAAIREDCQQMRNEIKISPSTLLNDLWPLVPFKPFRTAYESSPSLQKRDLIDLVLISKDPDADIQSILHPRDAPILPYDLLLCSTTSEIEIPIHQFIITARSKIIRTALEELNLFEQFTIPDVLVVKRGEDGLTRVIFQGADVVTLFNLALYFYSDSLAPVWTRPPQQQMAFRYRQVRAELQRIANKLEMNYLESALKRLILPASTLHRDMELAFADASFFENADIVVDLANGEEAWVHGALICQRCPFFEGLFRGRTGGQWLSERRGKLQKPEDAIRVDLRNISQDVFQKVLRHIYAGTGAELFDDVVEDGLDEFLDSVLDVMSAANELMLDRLSEVCQQVIGRYVTTRNVCQLLNAIAPCSVTSFKDKALEYICYNLEAVLQHGHLEELDEDLFYDLDETATRLQVDCSIMSRTGQQEEHIRRKYPDLEKRIEQERRAKIDTIVLFNKYGEVDPRAPASFKAGSFHRADEMPKSTPSRRRSSSHMPQSPSPGATPELKGKSSVNDLMFAMDDDDEDHKMSSGSFKDKITAVLPHQPLATSASSPWGETSKKPVPFSFSPDAGMSTSSREPGKPWGAAPLPSARLDLKEIMQQAASSRTSNLSAGLAAAKSNAPPALPSCSFTNKISQKERKRQQQQLQQLSKSDSLNVQSTGKSTGTTSSPWQTVNQRTKAASRTSSGSAITAQPILSGPKAPQMTMRQTIANPSTPVKDKNVWTGQSIASPSNMQTPSSTQNPPSSRITSTPKRPSNTPSADSPGFAISDRPVTVQSVRHVPKPERTVSSEQRSLVDILSEQEIQKQEIRDFGSKRSLTEIQQEQEFQEWWDKESARVMEQEAAAAANAAKAKSKGSSRGGRRRGRGGGAVGAGDVAAGERKKIGNRGRGRGKEGAGGTESATDATHSANPARRP
ncbi:uncharacterized protein PV09_04598 [Verruconis gallopava]|uniref:BTB domain-containing protein n=1 Tax=Verruconis gallopava TaxID=253628 RepID=A0A0D2AYQ4_9PEZI|nr:uncharacterized protein PV09_04598 [Verruconis gallopava]KIW04304.1 hypothetical protein PV09_04598 [Verruconis gallopava]